MRTAFCVLCVAVVAFAFGLFVLRGKSSVQQVDSDVTAREPQTQAAADASASEDMLWIDPPYQELDPINWGDIRPFELWVVNNSEQATKVLEIGSSCDCTTTAESYIEQVIEAGDSLLMEFEVHAGTVPGDKNRTITVTLETENGFDTVKLSSEVHYTCRATYSLSTDLVDFGDVNLNSQEPLRQVVHFTSLLPDEPISVGGDIKADSWITTKTNESYILIEIDPTRLPVGNFYGKVIIPTSDNGVPLAIVRVLVNGVVDVKPSPDKVFLVGTEKQNVSFTTTEDQPAEIVSISSSNDSVKIHQTAPDTIEVWNPSGTALDGNITIAVRDASGKEGKVIVYTFGK